jgi:hypothetical protein
MMQSLMEVTSLRGLLIKSIFAIKNLKKYLLFLAEIGYSFYIRIWYVEVIIFIYLYRDLMEQFIYWLTQ